MITRLARREARALTLVPRLEIQTPVATPRVRVDRRPCPWCDAVAPAGKLRPILDPDASGHAVPALTLLSCEVVGLRSLLAPDLLGRPVPMTSRAAFWAASSPDRHPSDAEVHRMLKRLDEAEAWWDLALPAIAGGRPDSVPAPDGEVVLPMSGRIAGPDVPARLTSLHFVTAHLGGPLLDRLDRVYRRERLAAVGGLLAGPAVPPAAIVPAVS
jgi:hypothetical protein